MVLQMQVELGTPAEKPEKGEDWEHEDERQDDDLEQGDEEGSDHDQNAVSKKCASCSILHRVEAPAIAAIV